MWFQGSIKAFSFHTRIHVKYPGDTWGEAPAFLLVNHERIEFHCCVLLHTTRRKQHVKSRYESDLLAQTNVIPQGFEFLSPWELWQPCPAPAQPCLMQVWTRPPTSPFHMHRHHSYGQQENKRRLVRRLWGQEAAVDAWKLERRHITPLKWVLNNWFDRSDSGMHSGRISFAAKQIAIKINDCVPSNSSVFAHHGGNGTLLPWKVPTFASWRCVSV